MPVDGTEAAACGMLVIHPPRISGTLPAGLPSFANHLNNGDNAHNTIKTREHRPGIHVDSEKSTIAGTEREGTRVQTHSTLQRIANFFHGLSPKSANAMVRYGSVELPKISPRIGGRVSSSSPSGSSREKGILSKDIKLAYASPATTCEGLREACRQAEESKDWYSLGHCYASTFGSVPEINNAFKMPKPPNGLLADDSGLNMDFLASTYEMLSRAPEDVHKAQLTAVSNCLLKTKRLSSRLTARSRSADELRAFFALSLSPLFLDSKSYGVFACLLRQIADLSREECRVLVHWYRSLNRDQFGNMVQKLNSFITCRLQTQNGLPPLSKCHWWVPSCSRVLAILNAANELLSPPLLRRSEFCNPALDGLDLFDDYCRWQSVDSASDGFYFCCYPFLLTILAKRFILQKDAEQQMVDQARRYLTETAAQQRSAVPSPALSTSDMRNVFLYLAVRRGNIVEDSLTEIAQKKSAELRRKLRVTFVDEPGLDRGGLAKEWFMLLVREMFSAQRGTFAYNQIAGSYWFSFSKDEQKLKDYHLAGVLMGLAIYNGVNLDIRFPPCVYKKLLSPPVVPYSNPRAVVGIDCNGSTVNDLACIMPDVAAGLQYLLNYDGDVENDLCLNFQASVSQFDISYTETLRPNGESLAVTASNRKEFVSSYVDWVINNGIYSQFRAFYHGFHSVCASNALLLLHPEEMEVLVCGSDSLNISALRTVTKYSGYSASGRVIRDFWDVVLSFSADLQKKLLLFTTGSDRLPVGGMSEIKFKICRASNHNRLPTSRTCFNCLLLPPYKNKKVMKQKLLIAVENAEGFWLQ